MTHTIGRFHLLKRLGGGGFGEVFLAEDPGIGRKVAIKLFRPKDENLVAFATSSDEEGLQILRTRFLNEAKILAALENTVHVVNVLEYGELPDGAPYYVMPYLPHALAEELGRDVFDVRALEELPPNERPRALPMERSLALLEQILRGMAAAHARGLIHRDIKPGNLMLTEEGELRIVDFGIAKAPDTSHSTVSHLGLGSRHYMAPEQRESAKHVDARADVYAIGRVAYRMLTGRLPVGRYADPNVAVPALGKPMNDLLLAALSEDREGRPADAGQMLERFLVARKSVGQASTSDTATWSGDGEAGIRDDLKPLRARIGELLHRHGRIPTAERRGLNAMAAIADVDDAGLERLILDATRADKVLQSKRRLADLIARDVKTAGRALPPAALAAYESAAQAVGWNRATLETLSKQALDELQTQNASIAKPATRPEKPTRTTDESPRSKGRLIAIAAALLVLVGAGWGVYAWRQGQIADAASKQAALQTTPTTTAPISPATTPAPSSTDPQRTRLLTIQDYLNRLGYRVAETGEADPRTVEAIKRFEQDHKLIVTGAPDELVQAELVKEYDRRDAEAWDKATKAHTEAAYLGYREAFPQGAHVNEVDSHRDVAAWVQARKQDTKVAYQRYQSTYPNGEHIGEVTERIAAVQTRVAEEERIAEDRRKAEERIAEVQRVSERKFLLKGKVIDEEILEQALNGGFRDNGDGTLTDSETGLVWRRKDNGSDIDWTNANAWCERWGMRLPNIEELAGIYERGSLTSCGRYTCKVSPLFELTTPFFWSSTQSGSSEAWGLSLGDGLRALRPLSSRGPSFRRALCVRHRS